LKIVRIDILNTVKMKRLLILFFLLIQWAVQAQMVGTPRMPFVIPSDGIRADLSTNRTAYDNAASTALVEITSAEYAAILTNLSGAAYRGIDNFTGQSSLGTINDMVGAGTNFSVLPANSYVAAVAFSTLNTSTGAIAVTCSSSLSGASICLTGNSASLNWTAFTVKYFAVKQPTTHCGSNTFLGRLSRSGSVAAAGKNTGSSRYVQTTSAACGTAMTNPIGWTPCLQVIATTNKQW
jgi:hypothetical protein